MWTDSFLYLFLFPLKFFTSSFQDLGVQTSNEKNNGSETADYHTSASDVSSIQRASFKEQGLL